MGSSRTRSRSGLSLVLFVLAQVVGAVLWLGYVVTWVDWQGFLGLLIGLFTLPGIVIFPFIYWVVEDVFPVNYFALWAASAVLMVLSGLASGD